MDQKERGRLEALLNALADELGNRKTFYRGEARHFAAGTVETIFPDIQLPIAIERFSSEQQEIETWLRRQQTQGYNLEIWEAKEVIWRLALWQAGRAPQDEAATDWPFPSDRPWNQALLSRWGKGLQEMLAAATPTVHVAPIENEAFPFIRFSPPRGDEYAQAAAALARLASDPDLQLRRCPELLNGQPCGRFFIVTKGSRKRCCKGCGDHRDNRLRAGRRRSIKGIPE